MEITLKSIINKHILVGITYLNRKKDILKRIQFYGKIIIANEQEGIVIKKTNSNEEFRLPPELLGIKIAESGEYKLKSTGEVIVNPELIGTWIIEQRRYK